MTICATRREGNAPTLVDPASLYHAIAHGCRAGRHQEAVAEVSRDRICPGLPSRKIEFYVPNVLGAVASDPAGIASFSDDPYETPGGALICRLASENE
jgi:hypothetical protein